MDENKSKDGMSVKEIEAYAKNHRFEVFFCLLLIVAGIATLFKFWPKWSILLAVAGGVVAILLSAKVGMMLKKMLSFVFGRDKIIQIVVGCGALLVAIFLPPLIFLLVGAFGGHGMLQMTMQSSQGMK